MKQRAMIINFEEGDKRRNGAEKTYIEEGFLLGFIQ